MTVAELAARVASGRSTAAEVLEEHISRLEARNPALNAVVVLDLERARRQAAEPLPGPLAGVPFTVKEAIDTSGLPTSEASRLRAPVTPARDAPAVARLRAAGAILLGKTNVSELCAFPDTANLVYGATRNPADPARSAGGSSGGEAAAVAAGLSAFGLGSDYGGSIRAPAHFCGVAGIRPGTGRVPGAGHRPASQSPARRRWSTIGPIARTVADLEVVLSVLAGAPLGGAPLPFRVGVYCDILERPVETACAAAVEAAAARLPLEVVEVSPPFQLEAELLFDRVSAGEMQATLAALASLDGRGSLDGASPQLQSIWETVRDAPAAPLRPQELGELERRAFAWLADYPVLLAPAAAAPAFPLGTCDSGVFDLFHHCKLASVLGLPAAIVPAGPTAAGLPVGVQVIGRRGREDEVLAVARAVEQAG